MTKSDVAALLRCCERTVERQVKLNAFPPPQRFGKESLWFQSVVFAWLEKRRAQQQQWVAGQQGSPAVTPAPAPAVPASPPAAERAPKTPSLSRSRPWQAQAQVGQMFQTTAP